MLQTLPGTTISAELMQAGDAKRIIDNIFLGGGLVLSQMSKLSGLEPYIIQNWVKRGFMTSPKKKQYTETQFCRVIIINMLKETLQLDRIVSLLGYINGHLDDESDDLIDDFELYCRYVNIICRLDLSGRFVPVQEDIGIFISEECKSYKEPRAGARERLENVLWVMCMAHCSAIIKRRCEDRLGELEII